MWRLAMALAAIVSILRLSGYLTEPRLSEAEIHAVSGEPDRFERARFDRTITIVSWNIERGVRFERIASTLKTIDADVVLLQEVDRYCRRSGNRDVARELASSLEMNWASAGEFQEIGEAGGSPPAVTGQTILSRAPIRDAAAIVFGSQALARWRFNPLQPRRGARIAMRARTGGLLLYNLHLESGGDDDLRSRQLNDVLADERSQPGGERVVIGGDFNNASTFNSFFFDGLRQANFIDAIGAGGTARTSVNHRHSIDWMFVKGASASGAVRRVDDASDHFPVVVQLDPRR